MQSISNSLCDVFEHVMESHKAYLAEREIAFDCVEHEICDDRPAHFTSEVRVMFQRSGQIIDCFEFHLFVDGKQMVEAQDIAQWVQEHISSIGV